MIRPHLDYVDFVVDSTSSDRIPKLDNLQKKALRRIEYSINNANRQDKDVLCEKYKIEDLRLRRKRNLAKIMYSRSHDSNNLKEITTEINLRSKSKIKMNNNKQDKGLEQSTVQRSKVMGLPPSGHTKGNE